MLRSPADRLMISASSSLSYSSNLLMTPKRSRSGADRLPALVVAPIKVNLAMSVESIWPKALADDDVQGKILHGRIKNLFDGTVQPVDFVDKEHIVLVEVGQNRCQVPCSLDRRPGGDF